MNHLLNAIHKSQHQYKRTWAGYLLPKEILALNDVGVACNKNDIEIAIFWKRTGRCAGRWFYFDANKKFDTLKNNFSKI
jgi:hypothetical protein